MTTKGKTAQPAIANREAWLIKLMQAMARDIMEPACKGSTKKLATWRVSCSWPGGGSARTRSGECWSTQSSKDGTVQMFISPILGKTHDVDHILLHEMVHASVGVAEGHKGKFRTMALALGLTGKMTATVAGPELRAQLDAITAKLGPYPHAGMKAIDAKMKVQSTRMLKFSCVKCGYSARTTAKWLAVGVPTCCCGGKMKKETK